MLHSIQTAQYSFEVFLLSKPMLYFKGRLDVQLFLSVFLVIVQGFLEVLGFDSQVSFLEVEDSRIVIHDLHVCVRVVLEDVFQLGVDAGDLQRNHLFGFLHP